ncbi:choice-of-anchor L domain-containing protein [Blastococcus sp. BMG 814]|uniref:Choice-of-anchor L domain-containing protein n=1 Tax=Blastococcus carthaginiensis TaxID=3050034 RepID=A0ABT9IE96_9ACTN|nr:choice-of-anchor L domain-containing protein [Blastococcus carthaginiensis]MDP5183873.1 choice-of-anchor L domain-containing protein [Blastococcus carthaginiensis]
MTLLVAVLALVGVLIFPAAAAPRAGALGTIEVIISAPDGVPAIVNLAGRSQYIAAKPPSGTSTTVTLAVGAGTYRVEPRTVTFDGQVYPGRAVRPTVTVRAGQTAQVAVEFAAADAARDLHATAVEQTSVSLTWTSPPGATVKLRRTLLDGTPQPNQGRGTVVVTQGTTAVDTGLEPGRRYAYSLETQTARGWSEPLTVVVGTAPVAGSPEAAFVTSPTTLLATAGDVVSVITTGSGIEVVLDSRVPTPLPGSAVVLPVSETLEGGFLGTVQSVSPDGRRIGLVAGGLSDAFDYYSIDIPDIPDSLPADDDPQAGMAATTMDLPSQAGPLAPAEREAAAAASGLAAATSMGAAAAAAAPSLHCDADLDALSLEYSPSITLGGHFSATVDKYEVLGVGIPTGASIDLGLRATVTGAMTVGSSAEADCELHLPKVTRQLTVYPVPISFTFTPIAEVEVDAAVSVSNLGFSATAGVRVSGWMGVSGGSSFSGSREFSAGPLVPVAQVTGGIDSTIGGQVVVGPGAGTSNAGVVAGVGGTFSPIDAAFGPAFPSGDSRYLTCMNASAEFSAGLYVTAKAWVGSWSATTTIAPSALQGSWPYSGSPWDLPDGCADAPAVDPGSTLLGSGVTEVTDSIGGLPTQWGHVDGFAPGEKTWVLSTGLVASAIGTPGQFASTDLGRSGDEMLSQMAGQPTYDAAYYEVTLVPTGDTLHVRYVFASEEYPEYVGSSFNDVMGVFVDGVNCATVPGTGLPVAVNTVNDHTNANYYVDNSTGAAGYSTSMDGLTVPLTCSVPVTAGQPVTVRIAAADSADHIYDSAIALVDGGIWAD